jgi:hypothetical protein
MPQGLVFQRTGAGADWGTTDSHQAAVVSGSITTSGVVWIRSSWLSPTGSDALWRNEIGRTKRDYGASFVRYDRSQGSNRDKFTEMGLEAGPGDAHVEARIGAGQGLVLRKPPAIYFDLNGPGVPLLQPAPVMDFGPPRQAPRMPTYGGKAGLGARV